MYLQQCQPLSRAQSEHLDNVCLDGLLGILDIDASENAELGVAVARWFLPWKAGGLGFHAVQHSAAANYAGPWLRDLGGLAERMDTASPQALLDNSPCVKAVLHEATQSLASTGALVSSDLSTVLTETSGEKQLASKWRSEVVTRITNNIDSGAANGDVICMRESGGKGGGAWLKFPWRPAHHMTNQQFTTSVRLRMNLPVYSISAAQPQHCKHKSRPRTGTPARVCSTRLDVKGHHPLCCKLGGHVIGRHNDGRDCLASLMKERSVRNVNVEQHAPDVLPDQRHPDVDFFDHRQRHGYMDFEVCTPYEHAGSLPSQTGTLIEANEGVKRRKYRQLFLIPAVCSHLGRFGSGIQKLLHLICCDEDDAQRSRSVDERYQTLSCEIQKGNVAILGAAGALL